MAAAEEAAATKLTIVLLSHGSEIASQQAPETQTEQTGHQDLAFRQLGLSSVCPLPRLLLLLPTQRAHAPDPQAREPLSLWTEVWPTQPVPTQRTRRRRRAPDGVRTTERSYCEFTDYESLGSSTTVTILKRNRLMLKALPLKSAPHRLHGARFRCRKAVIDLGLVNLHHPSAAHANTPGRRRRRRRRRRLRHR